MPSARHLLRLRVVCCCQTSFEALQSVVIGELAHWNDALLPRHQRFSSFTSLASLTNLAVVDVHKAKQLALDHLHTPVTCVRSSLSQWGLRSYCKPAEEDKRGHIRSSSVQETDGQTVHNPRLNAQSAAHKAGGSSVHGGWSWSEVVNVPNLLSFGRMLSGPAIAALVVDQQWEWAVGCLAAAALSDYFDGLVAKNMTSSSVLGSYLDPLADKVLVCSVVAALGYEGSLSPLLVCVVVARDVFLVAGAFYHRCSVLKWKWPGLAEFFRIGPSAHEQGGTAPMAPLVRPLFISKVNTAFQMMLVGAAMTHSWLAFPDQQGVDLLGAITAATTLWSCGAYVAAYRAGKILQ